MVNDAATEPWLRVVSGDGAVGLAVHLLAGPPPSAAHPVLLVSHATGFHAQCYRALAAAMAPEWTVVGLDHRGHGYTAPHPLDARLDCLPTVDWRRFGDDATTLGVWLRDECGVDRLAGYGHSMGAVALIEAAAREARLFNGLVLFEPIAPAAFLPRDVDQTDANPVENALADGALRRRRHFASFEAAFENYASKAPFDQILPEVLDAYVRHGFMAVGDGVTLRCTPEFESATFRGAMTNGIWEQMPLVEAPTVVAAGPELMFQPSQWAPGIAERIPGASLVVFDDQDHFGPFSHPAENAALIDA